METEETTEQVPESGHIKEEDKIQAQIKSKKATSKTIIKKIESE